MFKVKDESNLYEGTIILARELNTGQLFILPGETLSLGNIKMAVCKFDSDDSDVKYVKPFHHGTLKPTDDIPYMDAGSEVIKVYAEISSISITD